MVYKYYNIIIYILNIIKYYLYLRYINGSALLTPAIQRYINQTISIKIAIKLMELRNKNTNGKFLNYY